MNTPTDTAEATDYALTVRIDPDSVPRINRLRRALKCLYRSFGIRVLSVSELPPGQPDGPRRQHEHDGAASATHK